MKQAQTWPLLLLLAGGCGTVNGDTAPATPPPVSAPAPAPEKAPATPATAPDQPDQSDQQAPYDEAIALAGSTAKLVQQAQSPDDWSLIVNRWQRVIAQLKQLPSSNPNYANAQNKIAEYKGNLTYAQQQLKQLSNPPAPMPIARPAPRQAPTTAPATASATPRGFTVPILSRSSGTPVILATFNGDMSFPMILDTGASSTLITGDVASRLGLSPTGQIQAATASDRVVVLNTTELTTLSVGGLTRNNVTVAIGDAVPVGLLGNDFHQGYDLNIRADRVEFVPR
ncbi:MAG: retropepsin-like aspartic protease [Cyanobacteria bacterium P01_A01_bin.105]